jgi:hypothetical protein
VAKGNGGATERIWKDQKKTVPVSDTDRYRIVRGPGQLFEGVDFGRYKGKTDQKEWEKEWASFVKTLAE